VVPSVAWFVVGFFLFTAAIADTLATARAAISSVIISLHVEFLKHSPPNSAIILQHYITCTLYITTQAIN
jgi:hypothetical protein